MDMKSFMALRRKAAKAMFDAVRPHETALDDRLKSALWQNTAAMAFTEFMVSAVGAREAEIGRDLTLKEVEVLLEIALKVFGQLVREGVLAGHEKLLQAYDPEMLRPQ